MKKLSRIGAVAGCLVGVLAFAGSAMAATTVTVTLGPIPVPGVPVQVCVNQTDVPVNECVTGPAAQTVTLTVVAQVGNVTPVLIPPTVVPIPCPAGTEGVALKVNTGSAGATVTGSVTLSVNGMPVTIPINETVVSPNQTVTIFACAGVSPGL